MPLYHSMVGRTRYAIERRPQSFLTYIISSDAYTCALKRITARRSYHNHIENMKNPQNGEWYLLALNGDTHFITVTYSPRRVARAWHGYGDTVLSTAGGYGYDKESTVLSDACAKLSDTPKLREAMGVGIESLKRLVSECGGKLYSRHEAMELIHAEIIANKY